MDYYILISIYGEPPLLLLAPFGLLPTISSSLLSFQIPERLRKPFLSNFSLSISTLTSSPFLRNKEATTSLGIERWPSSRYFALKVVTFPMTNLRYDGKRLIFCRLIFLSLNLYTTVNTINQNVWQLH